MLKLALTVTYYPPPVQVDLDIHTYTYIARTALLSFMTRLASVIWEVAFVIQGNASDELPEQVRAGPTVADIILMLLSNAESKSVSMQVLACARIYRTDFTDEHRSYASFLPKSSP